ncbi:phage portal protein, partial [Streptomyces californicus]|uniref:phage portal protein n=1 Tax=Streptomyces californicus TaxID=67351 RepID=UPI00366A12D6
KHHNPIAVVIGQQLKGEGINPHIIGQGVTLDSDADMKYLQAEIDHQAFKTIYETLMQQMINVASVPAVAMNATDVSNLSETSMQMLYQLADMKAGINEQYIREGMDERHEKVIGLMGKTGKAYSEDVLDTLNMKFTYARPINETEVIDNLVKMYEAGAMSIESLVELSPYISNQHQELERILKGRTENVTEVKPKEDSKE